MADSVGTNNNNDQLDLILLVEAIRNKDAQAENELLKRFYTGLNLTLLQRSQNHALADDITQDTFILVLEKIRNQELRDPLALPAFIRQTGINLLTAHYRKETRRQTDTVGEVQFDIKSEIISFERQLESRQIFESVVQLISELNIERDQLILRAFYIQQISKKEICVQLDISPAHFDRVLFRARERLKQIVKHKLDLDS